MSGPSCRSTSFDFAAAWRSCSRSKVPTFGISRLMMNFCKATTHSLNHGLIFKAPESAASDPRSTVKNIARQRHTNGQRPAFVEAAYSGSHADRTSAGRKCLPPTDHGIRPPSRTPRSVHRPDRAESLPVRADPDSNLNRTKPPCGMLRANRSVLGRTPTELLIWLAAPIYLAKVCANFGPQVTSENVAISPAD